MLILNELRYKNFLAAGNAFINIRLDKHPSTLIIGVNGVGKSTMTDAICFAMFGKPLRDINKPALLNSINERDCVVELDFTTPNGAYMVRRGIKPNVFEIYQNGALIPQPADSKDYQTILETSILKLNFKAFGQVVVLGNATYVPFMRLPATGRRGLIEDLLDIEVFSSMNVLNKEDSTELRASIDANASKTRTVNDALRMAKAFVEEIQTKNQTLIDSIGDAMVAQSTEVAKLIDERDALNADLQTYLPHGKVLVKATSNLDEANKAERTIQRSIELTDSAINTLARERKSELRAIETIEASAKAEVTKKVAFWDNDKCPQCEQSIAHDHKASKKDYLSQEYDRIHTSNTNKRTAIALEFDAKDADAKAKHNAFIKKQQQCAKLVVRFTSEVEAASQIMEQAEDIQLDLNRVDAQLPLQRRRLIELETQYKAAQNPPAPPKRPDIDVPALEAQLATLMTEQASLSRQKVVYDAASLLLKDNGIKTRVVRHYLPIINKFINQYLIALNFPIQFEFDESFTERIQSRHRSKFTYESFSEGEKKRIDLALLLTWRAIARMKNSASVSLLVLDEVMDGSLDLAGIDDAMKLINGFEAGVNVYVISHRDQNVDKFSQVMTFAMRKGFSELL